MDLGVSLILGFIFIIKGVSNMNSNDNYVDYIGDGVYVEYDGHSIILKANSHLEPTDTIYLEPAVLSALIKYEQRLMRQIKAEEK